MAAILNRRKVENDPRKDFLINLHVSYAAELGFEHTPLNLQSDMLPPVCYGAQSGSCDPKVRSANHTATWMLQHAAGRYFSIPVVNPIKDGKN